MAGENSFDIVSDVDLMEVSNAVQQAMKEIRQRFDFKARQRHQASGRTRSLNSDDESAEERDRHPHISKLVKRGVSLKALEYGPSCGREGIGAAVVTVRKEFHPRRPRRSMKFIKGSGIRVQAQIQEDQVRVVGKKRDDLQAVIQAVKGQDFGLDLQFTNYRST
jgi:uncharacterized protein YajQ (UPF0234 family)